MAAIVRVKRRINDDPADYMVLSSKRQRKGSVSEASGNNDTEEVKNLFKFAGTVQPEDDCVSRAVREAIKKDKLEKEYKLHSVNLGSITSRARTQSQASQQTGRYTVVSQRRALQLEGLDRGDKGSDSTYHEVSCQMEKPTFRKDYDNKENEDAAETEAQKMFLMLDVEHEDKHDKVQKAIERPKANNEATITCNDVPLEREVDQYVYDVYYMNRRDADLRMLEHLLTIEAYRDDTFHQYRDADELEVYDDEDDSNDEGNWRNDYPDEDPKFLDGRDAEYTGGHDYISSFGLDDDDELGTIIDRGLHLGSGAFGQEASSEDDEQEPAYDFTQTLDSGIWSHDQASANIWGSSSFANSDAVADDWVSKSLDTNFDPGSGIWGSSVMNPAGSSMMSCGSSVIGSSMMGSSDGGSGGSGGGGGGSTSGGRAADRGDCSDVFNPWMTMPQIVTADESASQLWAPSTDFDQYRSRILQELGDDDDKAT